MLLIFVVLPLACCGSVFLWAKSFVDQYPASIAADAQVPGLTRVTDSASRRNATDLLKYIESRHIDEDSFPIVYTDARKRSITLAATTRFVWNAKADLTDGFIGATPTLKLGSAKRMDTGPMGGHLRCASGNSGGKPATVCGWSDHGSLAIGVFPGHEVEEAAEILRTIRANILRR